MAADPRRLSLGAGTLGAARTELALGRRPLGVKASHDSRRQAAMKTLLILLLVASLGGCVVYPARSVYYRPAVVVY